MWTLLDWSLCFPKFCGVPATKPYWSSKPDALGFIFLVLEPCVQDPEVGLRTLTPAGEPLQDNYSLVGGSLTQGLWDLMIWFLPLLHISLSFPPYVFNCRRSIWCVPVFFTDGCSADICGLVCSWEEVSSGFFYNAILSAVKNYFLPKLSRNWCQVLKW